MNLYGESAESQLLIKIQGLNNYCMFGKLTNIFSDFFQKTKVRFYFAIYPLNLTQKYVKQAFRD